MAIVVSAGNNICYAFMSDGFKRLGKPKFPRKGMALPESATLSFNSDADNVIFGRHACAETSVDRWFDGAKGVSLDEEITGLGRYGHTLSVFSSEELPVDLEVEEDEEAALVKSWTPKFAYGR